jgi:hypothetical protein
MTDPLSLQKVKILFQLYLNKFILSFRGELDPASRMIRGKDEKNCLGVGKELDTSKYSIPF